MSDMSGDSSQESHLEKYSGSEAMRISQKDAEIEFLRQQVELLKKELNCEYQITQVYREELKETERELRRVENELSTVVTLQKLGLDRAKELAKSIVKSNRFVSEALANLLNGIYNTAIEPNELEQIDKSSYTIASSSRCDRLKVMDIKLEAHLSNLEAWLGDFKAEFDEPTVARATSQERDSRSCTAMLP